MNGINNEVSKYTISTTMKYTISYPQGIIAQQGIHLPFEDYAIIDLIARFKVHTVSEKIIEGGKLYCWCSYQLIQQQLPCLRTYKPDGTSTPWERDTIYRKVKSLQDRGWLLTLKREGKVFIALTNQCDILWSDCQHSDFPLELQAKSVSQNEVISQEETRMAVRANSDGCPSNNTIEDKEENKKVRMYVREEGRTVEGFGFKTAKSKLPSQDLNPVDFSFDQWWKIYGVDQGRMKSENLFFSIDSDDWIEIWQHTLLYVVATPKQLRLKPEKYLRDRNYKDEIIDRTVLPGKGNTSHTSNDGSVRKTPDFRREIEL